MKGSKEILYNVFEHIHNDPELSLQETRTSGFLASELKKCGYVLTERIGDSTGVMGVIDSGKPGPFLVLRADMDALPYVVDGEKIAKHTCGHDAHCAMVMTAAAYLAEHGIKRGKLGILFQPAEEVHGGAVLMAQSGVLNDADEIIGLHVRPKDELSFGTASSALYHSAGGMCYITVKGKEAHGARPHQGINAIECAVQIIQTVNSIKLDPRVSHSVKVTSIKGGGLANNVIPDECSMVLDMRSQDNPVLEAMVKKISDSARGVAAAFGAEIDIDFRTYPAAEFDKEMVELMHRAIERALGEGSDAGPIYSPGGEDFHQYKKLLPGIKAAFIGIGAEASPGLHAFNMEFRHEAMEHGADILIEAVTERLCR
ncbi:MAG: amidohydrolase [Firmicutes bacterium]|nr:amidohydrolase [Bacillota bacterium]